MSDVRLNFINVGKIDCRDGRNAVKITFRNRTTWDVHRAEIYADDKIVGICMLVNANEEDTVMCEIDKLIGIHNIKIRVDEGAFIKTAEFIYVEDFSKCDYVPTPDDVVRDLHTEQWEATDMLGRHIASVEDTRGAKKDKLVGMFYWSWREAHKNRRPVNVTEILSKYPAAEYDMNHPAWGKEPIQAHWNEPLYGYYLNSDEYVIRKHAIMLANAGVDFIMFDCTNGNLLWKDAYEPILEGFHKAREEGINVPKFAFMLNFCPMGFTDDMLRILYQDLYRAGKYRDLWFMLDGKPLIMAYPESLPGNGVCKTDTKILNEIREFFTFRPGMPGYGTGPTRPDHWPWLEIFPQYKYGEREDGSCEIMSVGVAQNANKYRICTHFNDEDTYGRSYTKAHGFDLLTKDSYKYGYNFQEQWERALDADPDIIFLTGWNEWQMMRIAHDPYWQRDKNSNQIAMVDQYDREHSRDIEPDIDGYLDTYYLQMVHNIRRFKGSGVRTKPSAIKTIDICGDNAQWDDVAPEYRNAKGGAINRDSDGYVGYHYTNDTARNNIVKSKVARDGDYVYFYVECADKLTAPAASNWMTLYIDADRSKATGWEGYDIAINRNAPANGVTAIEKHQRTLDGNTFTWSTIGEAKIDIKDNSLVIAVQRDLFGEGGLNFEFKWSDNMQDANIMDFYKNGDCAPMGRFNYLFKE